MAVVKIISGAQTGADRAGLDAALHLGLRVGGWIPLGRRTDEGPLSVVDMQRYGLSEHTSAEYPPRTERNVFESDGTVLFGNMFSPGCKLTIKLCRKHGRPYLCNPTAVELRVWVSGRVDCAINILNVAGNRERTNPGIYGLTYSTLVEALDTMTACHECRQLFNISDMSNYYNDGVRRCGRCTVEISGGPR